MRHGDLGLTRPGHPAARAPCKPGQGGGLLWTSLSRLANEEEAPVAYSLGTQRGPENSRPKLRRSGVMQLSGGRQAQGPGACPGGSPKRPSGLPHAQPSVPPRPSRRAHHTVPAPPDTHWQNPPRFYPIRCSWEGTMAFPPPQQGWAQSRGGGPKNELRTSLCNSFPLALAN